ncbi:MAG: hypothetical protein JWR75_831 [Devosia sp.]|nr:hypothetical protein [Devosia sp.]
MSASPHSIATAREFTSVEARIDAVAHGVLRRLPRHGLSGAAVEFLVFGLKQGWACLFGGMMLGLIIVTRYAWPEAAPFARYDFLVVAGLLIQIGMIAFRLETLNEAKVIFLFHLVGTGMELFKTAAGSWIYPEPSLLKLGNVPLFSGFMYACVGSYLARIQRIFDIRFVRYPPLWATAPVAGLIYLNFFTHHYIYDFRWVLLAAVVILWLPSVMHYRVFRFRHRMPLLLAFFLVAIFIWLAENIGTFSRAWLYPGQEAGWTLVSIDKLGSWYLLMIISVVLVNWIHPPKPYEAAVDSGGSKAMVAPAPTA